MKRNIEDNGFMGCLVLALALLAGALLPGPARAASLDWNGGVAGTWQNGGGGWLDGVAAATWNNATPDAANFTGTTPTAVNLSSGVTVGNLTFTSGDYTFGGAGTLTLNTGAIQVDSGLTAFVSNTLAGTAGLTKSGAGTLRFAGNTKNYTGTTVINAGAIQIAAAAAGSLGSSSTANITLNGGRLQTLFSANTTVNYNFTVGASGGELRNLGTDSQRFVLSANKLNGSGTLTMSFGSSGTRFQLGSTQTGFSGKWIVDSGGDQGRYIDIAASATAPFGTVTGDDAITFQNSGTMLVRNGVTIGSASQGITLGSGETKLAVAGNSTVTFASKFSGPAGNSLQFFVDTVNSTGILSNVNNSWLGDVSIVNSGKLLLGASGVLPDNGGTLTVNSTATLDLNGNSEIIGGLAGSGTVDVRVASANVTLGVGGNGTDTTFQGTLTNSGASASLQLVKIGTNTLTLSGVGIGHGGGTIISNGIIQITQAGAGRLGATSASAVTLAGGTLQGDFTANTTVGNTITVGASGGTLRTMGDDNERWQLSADQLYGSGTLTLAFGSQNTRFAMASSQVNFTGRWIINSAGNPSRFVDMNYVSGNAFGGATGDDAITFEDSAGVLIRDKLALGSAVQGITLGTGRAKITSASTSTGTVAGKISGPSGNNVQFYMDNGGSVLILSNAANSWLGTSQIAAGAAYGTLRLGAAGVFPDAGGTVEITSTARLDLNGYNETIAGLTGSGRADNMLDASSATLSVGGNSASTTFTGSFTNSGSGATLALTKVGSGTLTLSSANGHSGLTTVQAGVLRVTHASALGATTAGTTVNSGGALELQGGLTYASEALVLNGTGVGGGGALRNISGNNIWVGDIQLNNSAALTIASDSGDLKLRGAITQTGSTPPTFQGGGNVFIEGSMNGGFTRGTGVGDILVGSTSVISGDVTVSAGATGALKVEGTLLGNVTLAGGSLIGTGTVREVTQSNGTLSPAANGIARLGASALNITGGAYLWTITNATGTAGVNWDLISVSNGVGAVDVSGAGTGAITIRVQCAQTTLPNFDYQNAGSWKIVDAGAVAGFAASKFTVNDSAFVPGSEGGTWSVSSSGGDLYLNYTPATPINLAVRISNPVDPAPVGDTITYTVVVSNKSASAAGEYYVTNRLLNGMVYVGSSDSGSHSSGIVSWTLTNLAANSSRTLTLQAYAPVQGNVSVVAEVWPRRSELDSSDNRATNTTVVYCPTAGVVPNTAPASRTATNGHLLTFSVAATNADCNPPFLYATGLPSGSTFSVVTNGNGVVGTFNWAFPTSGTHPVRFYSYNATKTTSTVVTLIYVNNGSEANNSQGIPVSQTNWHVAISTIDFGSSGNVTLTYDAVAGITYDVYRTDQGFTTGAQSWTRVVNGSEADAAVETTVVDSSVTQRFFQVVPAGLSPISNGVWGVIRPTLPSGLSLFTPPLISDRDFHGELGTELADQLDPGSQVLIMAPGTSPSWTELTLDGGGNWVLTSGANVTTLNEGQGVFIVNAGGAASVNFTAPVGNDGSGAVTLQVGYNIIGLSEGKNLAANTAFEAASPISSFDEESSDQIVIQDGDGSWRRLIRRSGAWYDTKARANTTYSLRPGQAYYYIRRTSSTTVSF